MVARISVIVKPYVNIYPTLHELVTGGTLYRTHLQIIFSYVTYE